ncbi:response regulator [Sansalvadorimonas sp. 2012CJ34-2]|uniref:Response regulator n=1 Tax=Parendozoicomonas callyspongiae TaxID=2942213 RepID=A0ABT0PEZ2_9GAMM|nr:response regulator [Sansalvadorimonas sp. 2012CJ34-2]MCL6269873.1 response regulator [Sansalvadorimonas sp. 2012CJ34-2]
MISVLVADDHELVRCGIVRMLSDIDGIEVVGEACSGEEVQTICRELDVNIILMDVRMPGMGGLEATRRLSVSRPDIRIIALSGYEDAIHARKLLEAGAWGFLTKGDDQSEMIQAIKDVYNGRRFICASIATEMAVKSFSRRPDNPFEALSPQEFQVAMMVIDCYKPADIALKMGIGPKTVNSYRYRIFEKLGVTNDVGLTKLAIRHGVIEITTEEQ